MMQETTFRPILPLRRRRRNRRRLVIILLVLIVGGLTMFLLHNHFDKQPTKKTAHLINPASSIKPFNVALGGFVKSATITPLGKVVQEQLTGTTGTYSA